MATLGERLIHDVLLMIKMKTEMAVASTILALLFGCTRPERTDDPKVGFLNISTNALLEAISVGMHQDEVEKSVGIPASVIDKGVALRATNSTGAEVVVPMVAWVYACTNGSMWVVFGTNKVVHTVGPNPGISI